MGKKEWILALAKELWPSQNIEYSSTGQLTVTDSPEVWTRTEPATCKFKIVFDTYRECHRIYLKQVSGFEFYQLDRRHGDFYRIESFVQKTCNANSEVCGLQDVNYHTSALILIRNGNWPWK